MVNKLISYVHPRTGRLKLTKDFLTDATAPIRANDLVKVTVEGDVLILRKVEAKEARLLETEEGYKVAPIAKKVISVRLGVRK